MAVTRGPLFSYMASGTLGHGLNYARLRGQNYARRKPNPSQPLTGPQMSIRALYRFLASEWPALPDAYKATWEPNANQLRLTAYNLYLRHNLLRWTRFLTPEAALSGAATPRWPMMHVLSIIGGVRSALITYSQIFAGDVWGARFTHDTAGYPPWESRYCFAVYPTGYGVTSGMTIRFRQPLPAGRHFFRVQGFGFNGAINPADAGNYCDVTDV